MWKYIIAIVIVGVFRCVPKNRFEVINESGQTIHDLTITVSERSYNFGDVGSGELKSSFFYIPHSESYFEVQGCLEDGTLIH